MEIAVVGREAFVEGFKLVGVRHTYQSEPDEFEEVLKGVLGNDSIGIIILDQDDMDRLSRKTVHKLEKRITPVIITIGTEEDFRLRDRVKQVMGVDLWAS